VGADPLFSTLSRRGLNPYSPSPPDNGLGQYVSSPGNRAYCYAELGISSLAMAVIIASTHFAYPQRDGQAELAWVASYIQRWFTRFEVSKICGEVCQLLAVSGYCSEEGDDTGCRNDRKLVLHVL